MTVLNRYNPEAIDELERMIHGIEDERAQGASFAYTVNLNTGKKGKAAKTAWIPSNIGPLVVNAYRHIALLVGTVRQREARIRELEAELAKVTPKPPICDGLGCGLDAGHPGECATF